MAALITWDTSWRGQCPQWPNQSGQQALDLRQKNTDWSETIKVSAA